MKLCFILVAGMDGKLVASVPNLKTLTSFPHRARMKPVTPAVTSTMQATLSTGTLPSEHGIIANGLFTHNRLDLHPHLDLSSFADFRRDTSFWEQANSLVQRPRFWEKHRAAGKKVAMLFWQNSMPGTGPVPADIILTPKPTHAPDGKTFTACWSNPPELYAALTQKLGPFPLQHYWGPMASFPSSQWIINAAMEIWSNDAPDLQLVYIPHMDYNLQRHGPGHPSIATDVTALDAALEPLITLIRSTGGTPILCGDYGITPVTRCIQPNLLLRNAGLLHTKPDDAGKILIDYATSPAFAMCDHQIAHIYCKPDSIESIKNLLFHLPISNSQLPITLPIAHLLTTPAEKTAHGLNHRNAGDLIALAEPDAWFAHDWWLHDAEKPAWQFSVDIHRKPGYDPRELFFNPVSKTIAQDTALVKGSHGIVSQDRQAWPVVFSDTPIQDCDATAMAPWLQSLL